MSARVRLRGVEAICEGYEWYCEDPVILEQLRSTLDPAGPETGDPNPDATAARAAADLLGAEIIAIDEPD